MVAIRSPAICRASFVLALFLPFGFSNKTFHEYTVNYEVSQQNKNEDLLSRGA